MTISERNASTLWVLLLTAASTVTTLALACATPFPALAALAAVHMQRRDGIALMVVSWIASQIVGFGVLGYPHTASNLGWAAALGTAAIGSVIVACAALDRLPGTSTVARLATAYVTGFVAFKLVVLLWSLGLGGIATSFAPMVLATQFVRNGAILIGLFALYHALVAVGLPAAPRRQALAA